MPHHAVPNRDCLSATLDFWDPPCCLCDLQLCKDLVLHVLNHSFQHLQIRISRRLSFLLSFPLLLETITITFSNIVNVAVTAT